jgi:hypothetical protein
MLDLTRTGFSSPNVGESLPRICCGVARASAPEGAVARSRADSPLRFAALRFANHLPHDGGGKPGAVRNERLANFAETG